MNKRFKILVAGAALAAAFGASAQQVNVICSVQADWCNLMSTVYARTTGTKVNITAKGSGEALAQLNAERANPKTDIWFGGTGDPHLQAAADGLTEPYQSPSLPQLRDWAQNQAKRSGYRTRQHQVNRNNAVRIVSGTAPIHEDHHHKAQRRRWRRHQLR